MTGDVTQVDLPAGKTSGLKEAEKVLAGINGISFIRFSERDVVRHPLVQQIIGAYERHEKQIIDHRPGESSNRRDEEA